MKIALPLLISFSVLLTACSSTPVATNEPAPAASTVAAVSTEPAATANAASNAQAVPAYLDPNSPIYKQRSVYFDFDVFTIKPKYDAMLQQHAAYLKAHPELQVRLEGNADERGGREYNLSLGQKRSEAVKRALTTLGATAGQQEAVSFGEEKPKATGHDEASWAENRRVDIVYAPKK
jgi:peptidoglycan-associated lipoprotein